jgi:peptidoglycan/LPS O-acetylase OafA/YrhL
MSTEAGALARRSMGHLPALDGLRGIAIALVFLLHYYTPTFSGGSSGVDLFFVLSGFLITKLALEEHDGNGVISRVDFYLRRVFRILPAVMVLLATCLVFSFTVLSDVGGVLRREVLLSAVWGGNLWPLFYGYTERTALGHTWSLGIEEQFYLVWPVILALVLGARVRSARFARGVAIVTIASVVIGRVVVAGLLDYPHWESIPLFNFDGLAIGCLIAIFVHNDVRGVSRRLPRWPAFVAVAIVLVDFVGARAYVDHDRYDVRSLVLRLAFGYILLLVVSTPSLMNDRRLSHPVLTRLGLWSYSLYLWHLPLLYIFSSDRYPGMSRPVLAVIRLVLPFAAAILSYTLIERPALALGRRVRARRHERLVVGAPAAQAEPAQPAPALGDGALGEATWT